MAKFRKKPIVIEAEQWFPGKKLDGVCLSSCYDTVETFPGRARPHIHTLEGPLRVSDGDWIITGVNGEKYPCKPDIFEKTYESV